MQTLPDWCHFIQRLPRSRDHLIAKSAQVPFEDEPYAYAAVSRLPPPRHAEARIVGPVAETKAGLAFQLCDELGLHTQFVARRDKEMVPGRAAEKLGRICSDRRQDVLR